MPTDKPRITFMVEEDVLGKINDYRHAKRIKNQSQAIIALLEKGLAAEEQTVTAAVPAQQNVLPPDVKSVADKYELLDAHGRHTVNAVLDVEYQRFLSNEKPHRKSVGPKPAKLRDNVLTVAEEERATDDTCAEDEILVRAAHRSTRSIEQLNDPDSL